MNKSNTKCVFHRSFITNFKSVLEREDHGTNVIIGWSSDEYVINVESNDGELLRMEVEGWFGWRGYKTKIIHEKGVDYLIPLSASVWRTIEGLVENDQITIFSKMTINKFVPTLW